MALVRRTLWFITLTLVLSAPGRAQGPPSDVATRATGANRVVVARVATVRSRFETNRFGDTLIVSRAHLDVLETLKGTPATALSVAIEGGTVGDVTLTVSDMPSLAAGERAVFFLNAAGPPFTLHEGGAGVIKLDAKDRADNGMSLADVRARVRGVK